MSAVSPAEWVQMVSLAVALHASASAVFFLVVDADLADFDPRPLARRAADRVLVEVVRARRLPREAAIAATALLLLLTLNTSPESAR